jgi:two-component SAPR family response regulator
LGGFRVWRDNQEIEPAAWQREKALHLLQFLVTTRRRYLHKEQIIDSLWPELELETGDRDFRVALNAVNKALEPERRPRAEPRFIHRYELTYGLNTEEILVDADIFETWIAEANQVLPADVESAIRRYHEAVALYTGDYLPERRYEDWSSGERERLQVLALNSMTTLANLLIERSPLESIRLTQRVLTIDPVWEDAYRIQMKAYIAQGNRPLALRTYQQCQRVLEQEFAVAPLPETRKLVEQIRDAR